MCPSRSEGNKKKKTMEKIVTEKIGINCHDFHLRSKTLSIHTPIYADFSLAIPVETTDCVRFTVLSKQQ